MRPPTAREHGERSPFCRFGDTPPETRFGRGPTVSDVEAAAADGLAALAAAEWESARAQLERVVIDQGTSASAEVLDGLAEARWWSGDLVGALEARERAVAAWHQEGESERAVRGAVWIAVEYANGLGHGPASRGWLARASTMADAADAGTATGWVALGHAAVAASAADQIAAATRAVEVARTHRDVELEVSALARLGSAHVADGAVDIGVACFDEAMAAANATDFERLSTLGEVCCQLARAAETVGERSRFAQWLTVVQQFNRDHRYPPLVSFCATCCAQLVSTEGNWQGAEAHLRQAIDELGRTSHRARCGPPTAKLAELLVLQGRLEEAAELLGDDDTDATLLARARLALAKGAPAVARALADRALRRQADDLLALGPLTVVADASLAGGDRQAAAAAAERLAAIAERTGSRRAAGAAALLEGDIAHADGSHEQAAISFERALDHYAGLDGLLEVARAHLGLAETSRHSQAEMARVEAKAALAGFETAGATQMADVAKALLRDLGDRSHVGRKGGGLLTDRELEVLRLIARGLTNAEIADRLFISVKTAGNHVSNIFTKIGVRSRTEAAAFAAVHPEVLAGSSG